MTNKEQLLARAKEIMEATLGGAKYKDKENPHTSRTFKNLSSKQHEYKKDPVKNKKAIDTVKQMKKTGKYGKVVAGDKHAKVISARDGKELKW